MAMASGREASISAPEFLDPTLTYGSERIARPSADPEIELEFRLVDLGRIRNLVRDAALDSGLLGEKADALVTAVNEVTTNAVVHGRPPALLRVWMSDEKVVCEVRDAGPGIDDVLAGQLLPSAESVGGRGLWLARVLCDAVEIRTDGESTVSLYMAA
jgi:anti-sigma regulatory factor (Ser/Thr protein kinase)